MAEGSTLADAEARARVAEERLRVLEELGARLAEVHAPEDVARVVTDFTREAVDADVVALALRSPQPDVLELIDGRHLEPEVAAAFRTFPADAPLPLAVSYRERRAIYFERREDLDGPLAEIVAQYGRAAGASLPLAVGERTLGAIGFGFREARPIPPALRELLGAVAQLAAMAIERAELLARAQRETARIRYLAHAGALLASSMDPREILATLARLAVPELADWAAVDLFIGETSVDRVAVAHTDPEKRSMVEDLVRKYPPRLDDPADGLGRLLRTGEPELVPQIPAELLEHAARDEEHLRVLRALGLRSYVLVPIASRDRIRGAFTLIAAESGRTYGPDDLELAQEIARRASIALDQADVLAEVRRAEQAAKRADRQKDEFLAMLGHELRNPLAAIATAAELLRLHDGAGDPASERAQAAIGRQVDHMKRLLDDLLDVARIARGKLLVERAPVDLREVARNVVEDHRAEVERAQLTVDVVLPTEAVILEGDATRLSQVVANLLLNATKFTPVGGRIEVRLEVADGEARLDVSDTGIGVEVERIAELFDPFVQARPTHDRSHGGLGLGLALVKGIAELHGGSVSASSDGPGRGARFSVRLPLAGMRERVEPPATEAGGPPLDVLVVEDDPDGGEMLVMLVEALGHRARLARDGEEAISLARDRAPEVVLCDIGLPGGMDGYDVARALRSGGTTQEVMLVAVTGFGLPEHQRRARRAGFDRFFTKPIARTALRSVFHEAAERRAAS